MYRRKMSNGSSKRLFKKTVNKIHKKNTTINTNPMRGGIRL